MKRVLAAVVLFVFLSSVAAAGSAEYYVNGSEPAFLKDLGPQDERSDSPLAAVIVAVGVTLVIYNGLRRADKLPNWLPQ